MITLFGINNCDTIKKTKKWLDDQKAEFEFHDYKKLGRNIANDTFPINPPSCDKSEGNIYHKTALWR